MGSNWIDCKDQMPKDWGDYIVWGCYTRDCPHKSMQCNYYKGIFRSRDGIKVKFVTHWMPMPSGPIAKEATHAK